MFCDIPTFGRCCFCMPLRRGILTFGYLNILFSAFMVGVYSFSIHYDYRMTMLFHGVAGEMDSGVCLGVYCTDIIFTLALLYGAHKSIVIYLKIFYYYMLTTVAVVIILQIIVSTRRYFFMEFEVLPLLVVGLCLHMYLIFLVRSLLRKLDMSGHTYENQLQQFINGDVKIDDNAVYPNTVVPVENA